MIKNADKNGRIVSGIVSVIAAICTVVLYVETGFSFGSAFLACVFFAALLCAIASPSQLRDLLMGEL